MRHPAGSCKLNLLYILHVRYVPSACGLRLCWGFAVGLCAAVAFAFGLHHDRIAAKRRLLAGTHDYWP